MDGRNLDVSQSVLDTELISRRLADAISGPSGFAFVRYVHWFPDIRLEFAIQAIFAGNLRLAILNCLATYGQRN
jgi:hypothetical protein